jgi:cobalt transporter subunit CbtA
MFSKIVTSALFAGFAAGLIAAVLQLVFVQPVLLHAELYESGALTHLTAAPPSAHPDLGPVDWTRDLMSVLFTALVYCGYGLMLVALMTVAAIRGATITARTGLLWGIAGFLAVHFLPAAGLPPELPGASAADLTARQIWWVGTAIASGIGIWLIAFGRGWTAWGAAIVLLLAPHLVGAPHPDTFEGPVPPELGGLFAGRALAVGFAAWTLLGLFAGWFWQREMAGETRAQTA